MPLATRIARHATAATAIVLPTAAAVAVTMVGALVLRLDLQRSPFLASRVDVVQIADGGSWGAPWEALAAPASASVGAGLTSLISTTRFLTTIALAMMGLALASSAGSWILLRWRPLVIEWSLGGTLRHFVGRIGVEILALGTVGCVLGALAGAALRSQLLSAWPALVTHPTTAGGAAAPALAVAAASLAFLGIVVVGLLWMFARRPPQVLSQLRGEHVTPARGVLSVQSGLAVLQVAGALGLTFACGVLVRGVTAQEAQRRSAVGSVDTAPLRWEFPEDDTPAARAHAFGRLMSGHDDSAGTMHLTSPGARLGLGKTLRMVSFCNECFRGGMVVLSSTATVRVIATSPDVLSGMASGSVRGRDFLYQDTLQSQPVVILNDVAARALFPGADGLGREVQIGRGPASKYTVVGIANVPVPAGLGNSGVPPMAYVSLLQHPPERAEIALIEGSWTMVQSAVAPVGPDDPRAVLGEPRALTAQILDLRAPLTWFGRLTLAAAAAATVVSVLAVWALMTQTVAVRGREIALRLALGARPHDVVAWILRKALQVAGVGMWIGLMTVRWSWDVIGPNRRGSVEDGTLLIVQLAGGVVAVALLASWLPARRAARTDAAVLWSNRP